MGVLRRTLQTQLEKLSSKKNTLSSFFDNENLLKARSSHLIRMESDAEMRRWEQGPQRSKLKVEQDRMLSGIAVVCPSPGCGLAFVQIDDLAVHASQKHGMKLKISSREVKSNERKLKRVQSYRGKKVSEGLRSYYRIRRMASQPQEDLAPLQRLHYRLHPPPIFPQPRHPSDHQMPPPCLLFNPNTSQYQRHPLEQASYESDRQHELNQHCQPAPNFPIHPMLPSFPSTFQQVEQVEGSGQESPSWYQMPNSRNPWITTPVDTVEAD